MDPFDGRLDDVSVWNRALMPTEVRQLMVVGVSSNALNTNILDDLTLVWMTSDCVALWTLDEGSTKTHSEGKYKDVFSARL